jgi:hypothetical protein
MVERSGWRLVGVTALAALPLLGAALAIPSPSYFSGDTGAKVLQAEAIAAGGGRPYAIAYPAAAYDPRGELLPPSLRQARGGAVSIFPVLFALPSAGVIACAGVRALVLVPFAGGLLCALLAGVLAARLGAPARAPLAAAAALLATPLAFYTIAYWEHSVATALVLAAAVTVCGSRGQRPAAWLAAGALAALAAWTRTELAALLPMAALPLLRRRPLAAAAAAGGAVAGLAAGAAAQWWATGSWLPLHVMQHVDRGFLSLSFAASRRAAVRALLAPDPWTAAALALWLAALAAAVRSPRVPPVWLRALAVCGALAPVAAALVPPVMRVLAGARPAAAFPGAAATATWCALAALPVTAAGGAAPRPAARRTVGLIACWLVIAPLLLLPVHGGYQWGARFLLPACVLAVALACSGPLAAGSWGRVQRGALAAALAAGVAAQLWGVALLRHVARANRTFVQRLAELTEPGEVVVTDTFFLPELAAPIWEQRRFLYAATAPAAERLLDRLAAAGAPTWCHAWVEGGGGRLLAPEAAAGRGFAPEEAATRDVVNRTLHVIRYRASP